MKISKEQSQQFNRPTLHGWNYRLPNIEGGTSVVYNELCGKHDPRTTTDRSRIYFIISGKGLFTINGLQEAVCENDVIVIPPHTNFEFESSNETTLKCIVVTELLDLPK